MISNFYSCAKLSYIPTVNSEVIQGYYFQEIVSADRKKGEHRGLRLVAKPNYPAKITDYSILKFCKFSIGC